MSKNMPDKTKFTTVTVREQLIDLFVYKTGQFSAEYDGQEYTASTVDGLVQRLNTATKQKSAKFAIPFVRTKPDRWTNRTAFSHGTVTGRHASNRNLLIKWDGKKGTEQESHYGPSQDFLRLTPEEEVALKSMYEEQGRINARIDAFEKKHAININEEVTAMLTKAGIDA